MAYTAIDNPELYFQVKLYTGTGSSLAVTLDGSEDMAPALVWTKERDSTNQHALVDAVRGVTKRLFSDSTSSESTNSDSLTAFGSDGFTVNSAGTSGEADSLYVAWCWKGGTTSVPSGGSLTPSAVNFSADSGFGIYKYVNNTVSGATIAHGLVSAPRVVFCKLTSHTGNWITGHVNTADPFENFLKLNTNSAVISPDGMFTGTLPSSTLVTLGNNSEVNYSISSGAYSYIMYAFAPKQGFSKFSKYIGNGNADGPFVYTGFRPAWLIVKGNRSDNWQIMDNKRLGYNVVTPRLEASTTDSEYTNLNNCDFLSNGFKVRSSDSHMNTDGTDYYYMAFAEQPFVNSKGVPCNAR